MILWRASCVASVLNIKWEEQIDRIKWMQKGGSKIYCKKRQFSGPISITHHLFLPTTFLSSTIFELHIQLAAIPIMFSSFSLFVGLFSVWRVSRYSRLTSSVINGSVLMKKFFQSFLFEMMFLRWVSNSRGTSKHAAAQLFTIILLHSLRKKN